MLDVLGKAINSTKNRFDAFSQNLLNILSSMITAVLFAVLMAPGLIHGDSRWIMSQAISRNINTWHPPLLTAIWGYLLGASKFGPLFPFLIQVFSFFLGVYFTIYGLSKYLGKLTIVIPPLTLLLPQVWYISWVCTDGFWVAFSSLSAGLMVAYLTNKNKPILLYLSLVTAALLFMCRPYFIVVPLIFPIYHLLKSAISVRKRVSAVLICVFLPIMLVREAISITKPHTAYPDSFILLGDLAWVECSTRTVSDSLPADGLLPRLFIQDQDTDFCKDFDPVSLVSLFVDLGEGIKIRWINNDEEHRIAQNAWIQLWFKYPGSITDKKLDNYVRSGFTVSAIPLAPNSSWDNYPKDSSADVGFNAGEGFPLLTPILIRHASGLLTPIWNTPILGDLLINAYFFPLLGLFLLLQILRRKSEELHWEEISVLLFTLLCAHILLFASGMTSEPSRYFQMMTPSFWIIFSHLFLRLYAKPRNGINQVQKV
jgi:hypothetical protein